MTRKHTKLVHEGKYVAEIDVVVTDTDDGTGWAPYLSLAEAKKLDDVRRALKREAGVRAPVGQAVPDDGS